MLKFKLYGILFVCMFSSSIFGGCVTTQNTVKYEKKERTVAKYQDIGRNWGNQLSKNTKLTPGQIEPKFVNALISEIDYFKVHSELKDALKKGFREGYEDRVADLVLGPHITAAAGNIGGSTADSFVKVTEDFERGWSNTLENAVGVFIVLIAEGSQADRGIFINNFIDKYDTKYQKTQRAFSSNNYIRQVSDGGTVLFVNRLGALDIPKPSNLKAEIYHQAFTAMGDEWGKRFSTNLIKRDELVDVIRRSKPALSEVDGNNLGFIQDSFVKSYGNEAEEVMKSLLKDAGYVDKVALKKARN